MDKFFEGKKMKQEWKSAIANVLHLLGMDKPIRNLYYRLCLFSSTGSINISGIESRFWTTTLLLQNTIEYFQEQTQLQRFIENLVPGDIVWDIGANIGSYSIFSAKKIDNAGHIYAFEPESGVYSILKRNIRLNKIRNVTPIPVAIGDFDGETDLYVSGTDTVHSMGDHSLIQRPETSRSKKKVRKIKLRTGQAVVQQWQVPPPTAMKVDVEGAELKVLNGMGEILSKPTFRLLLCEVHPTLLPSYGDSVAEVESTILGAGFLITEIVQRGDQFHWMCTK